VAEVRISAEPRTEFGKGGARRTRRSGRIPAVLYGHGTDPRHVSLPTREFEHALRTDGANVLLSLAIEGSDELALPKSIQRDPVRGSIEHIDLILIRRGEKVTVDVPLQISGEIIAGGLLDHQLTVLSVAAEATHIPSGFEVSIAGLEIGASIHAKDVDLPAGTELMGDPEAVVVHILAAPTAEELEADLAAAEEELGSGAAGAAALAEAAGEAPAEAEAATEGESAEGGAEESPAEGASDSSE
jgi:large subunit ribosomal protein L25